MRIAGYIDHPRLKITIFQQENRYSLKLETALHEQTYKLRKGGAIETTEDVRRLVDQEFPPKKLLVSWFYTCQFDRRLLALKCHYDVLYAQTMRYFWSATVRHPI